METNNLAHPTLPQNDRKGLPLLLLVLSGLAASFAVIVLLAWYFSYQEYLHECANSCESWKLFPPLDQASMFAVIRNAVTAAAALGLGVTIVLSYRRQRVAEQTLIYTSETQRLAVDAQKLAAERLDRESLDTLRKRYLDIAVLLNSPGDLNRITALHALESLTTSWRQFNNDREASAAVNLLLSTARLCKEDNSQHAREFRQAVSRTLDRHLKDSPTTAYGWGGLTIDATGCLDPAGIHAWVIDGGNLTASPRGTGYINIDGFVMHGGTVSLASLCGSQDRAPWGNTVKRLVMHGGHLRVAAWHDEDETSIVVSESTLKGGELSFLGSPENANQRTYSFVNTVFAGTVLTTSIGTPAEFEFTNCRFEAAPSVSSWLTMEERTATFHECTALNSEGKALPVSSLEELYLNFGIDPHKEGETTLISMRGR